MARGSLFKMTLLTKFRGWYPEQVGLSALLMGIMAGGTGDFAVLAERKFSNFQGRDNIDYVLVSCSSVRMAFEAQSREGCFARHPGTLVGSDMTVAAFMRN